MTVAPEQAEALPQSGGLARCGHGGTQESRRRVSLPHTDAQAGSPRAGQGIPEPKRRGPVSARATSGNHCGSMTEPVQEAAVTPASQ